MPTHDIIDNRKEKLVHHINRILSSTEAARFAVGYFFLSGLESIAQRLAGVKELRLLIGNTTNRETPVQGARSEPMSSDHISDNRTSERATAISGSPSREQPAQRVAGEQFNLEGADGGGFRAD